MNVMVRRSVGDDIEAVIASFVQAIRQTAAAHYDSAQIDAWARVDRAAWAAALPGSNTWVALIDGAIAGFIDLKWQGLDLQAEDRDLQVERVNMHREGVDLQRAGHLDMLYVHPAYQRRGVATRLLEHIEEEARGGGLVRLTTESSITARPFFEARAFQTTAAQVVTKRGQQFINFLMQKNL